MGGTLAAIEKGLIQAKFRTPRTNSSNRWRRGETIVVGVNRFRQADENPPVTLRMDPALEREQVDRLREVRASRSAARWTRS